MNLKKLNSEIRSRLKKLSTKSERVEDNLYLHAEEENGEWTLTIVKSVSKVFEIGGQPSAEKAFEYGKKYIETHNLKEDKKMEHEEKDMSKLAQDSEKFSDEVEKRMKHLATDDRGEPEAEDMGTGTVDKSKVSPEGDKQLSAKRLDMDADMKKLWGTVQQVADLVNRASLQCSQAIRFANQFGEPELATELNQIKSQLSQMVSKLDY